MKVMDASKVGKYICECGRVMIIKLEGVALSCPNTNCEQWDKLYEIPDSVYVELERIKL